QDQRRKPPPSRTHPPHLTPKKGSDFCHTRTVPSDTQHMMRILLAVLVALFLFPSSADAAGPVVVHVIVPLCHNDQIVCGSAALGDPDNLETNLYWGALYGARRMFERPRFGYEKVAQQHVPEGLLERAVFRRRVGDTEHLTVLHAIDGNRIND